VAYVVF